MFGKVTLIQIHIIKFNLNKCVCACVCVHGDVITRNSNFQSHHYCELLRDQCCTERWISGSSSSQSFTIKV